MYSLNAPAIGGPNIIPMAPVSIYPAATLALKLGGVITGKAPFATPKGELTAISAGA